jgi:hypothetical protein
MNPNGQYISVRDCLKDRHHLVVEWEEYHEGRSKTGEQLTCYLTIRASVHDCVNLYRSKLEELGVRYPSSSDAFLLSDFLDERCARVLDPSTGITVLDMRADR